MNPMEMIRGLMGKGQNPQQMVMNMIGNKNPMINNLMQMAKNGNSQGVESFARNMFKEQGRDFDKEFGQFMQSLNGPSNQNQTVQTNQVNQTTQNNTKQD